MSATVSPARSKYSWFACLSGLAAVVVVIALMLGIEAGTSDPVVAGGATITVTRTFDPGNGDCFSDGCTLREAIELANLSPGNTIAINSPGCPPVCVITPKTALPAITQPGTTIDGTTQPGLPDQEQIGLNGVLVPPGVSGLTTTAEATTVKGLRIAGFPLHGIDASSPARQNLTLDQVKADNNGQDGLNASVLGALTINRSVFQFNGASGVYASNSTMNTALFEHSTASNNGVDGFNAAVANSLDISSNTISNNGASGVYASNFTTAAVEVINNTVEDNGFDGINVAASVALTVMGNDIIHNSASGLYAGASTVASATISNNSIGSNSADGVNVAVSGTLTVTGNLIYSSGSTGLNAGAATTTTGVVGENGIAGNSLNGVVLRSSGVRVHHNQIVANASTGVQNLDAGTLNAEDNWWGCNEGPGQPGCDTTSGAVDGDPWLVLTFTVDPDTVPQGGTSTLTGNLNINSDALDTSADGHVSTPTPVVFSANAGHIADDLTGGTPGNSVSRFLTDGIATAVYTADTAPGTVQVTAEFDNEVVTREITVTEAGTPTPTPTPSPSPTPTPTSPAGLTGDADCDEGVDAVDALWVLRFVAGMEPFASCIDAANVKCDDAITSVDALFILRHVVELAVNLPTGCSPIGE